MKTGHRLLRSTSMAIDVEDKTNQENADQTPSRESDNGRGSTQDGAEKTRRIRWKKSWKSYRTRVGRTRCWRPGAFYVTKMRWSRPLSQ